MWTANTERYCKVGRIHDTEKNLRAAIRAEIWNQSKYAMPFYASADVPFINEALRIAFVRWKLELLNVYLLIGGDDFEQTKQKWKVFWSIF